MSTHATLDALERTLHRPRPCGGTRVLVASASRLYAEALMLTVDVDPQLEPIGYALDPSEALELIDELEPDVILVGDLREIDNVTFTRIVHALSPRVRIIVLADRLVPAEVEAAYAAGAADYLAADVYADDLLAAIEASCARQVRFERSVVAAAPAVESWLRAEA
jgi:DNA-binding NarL/FixJ family response regulator